MAFFQSHKKIFILKCILILNWENQLTKQSSHCFCRNPQNFLLKAVLPFELFHYFNWNNFILFQYKFSNCCFYVCFLVLFSNNHWNNMKTFCSFVTNFLVFFPFTFLHFWWTIIASGRKLSFALRVVHKTV